VKLTSKVGQYEGAGENSNRRSIVKALAGLAAYPWALCATLSSMLIMELARFALIEFSEDPEEWTESSYTIGRAHVQAVHRWTDRGHFVLAAALTPLNEESTARPDGYVGVPDELRQDLEVGLVAYADLVSVSKRASRALSSPIPYVGILTNDAVELDRLNASRGIYIPGTSMSSSIYHINPEACLTLLSDRLEGTSLIAEALSQSHASGRFRELFRFFERAFAASSAKLTKMMWTFAEGTSHRFSEEEIRSWLRVRGKAVHADRRSWLPLGRDLTNTSTRMEDLAYDVLLNKAHWGVTDAVRRDGFPIPSGTISPDCKGLFARQGLGPSRISLHFIDAFGTFPLHLPKSFTHAFSERWFIRSNAWSQAPPRADDIRAIGG
jgi:hypothetical protein